MRLVAALVIAVLAGCGPTESGILKKLKAQSSLPDCPRASVQLLKDQSIGFQDYIVEYGVRAPASCMRRWRSVLAGNPAYKCDVRSCTRYAEHSRFDEEWAIIKFNSETSAQVEFTKI